MKHSGAELQGIFLLENSLTTKPVPHILSISLNLPSRFIGQALFYSRNTPQYKCEVLQQPE